MDEAISKEAAQRVLGPHHDVLALCVTEAWEKYNTHIKPTLPMPSRRGRANAMYEYMVNGARTHLGDTEGVRAFECSGRFLLGFPGLVVRFKKLDNELHTSNYKTQLALRFDRQQPLLPGILDVARLTVGYVLNALGTDLLGVHVVLSHGNRVAWSYPISRPAEMTALPPDPFSAMPVVSGKEGEEEGNDIAKARKKKEKKK